ncbi:YhgE/Pip family protein [Microbacterium capsulatum]|uniref:YhgE/Pip family protein n=1 Tax=Microbacterium capsulatum TaxID=3041921 RepID=A0ABU0XKR3_9MICO|nr:YhgE/Pip family protein [Microbacterium sp. ASV81]MDQ4215691.1 YhgE/Pip family protein [Microbacterium sp. ASV81]
MNSRLSALIERARSHKPVTALTLVGVLLLPAILGGVLVAALQDPTQRLDSMTAAIVNDDEPVTVNGQLAPLGRQLAAGLVDGTGKKSQNLTWVISNEKDAAQGLKDGDYQAVVRIPRGFSAAAVSGGKAIQDSSASATQATIAVTTAPQARAADGLIANQIADTAAATMGSTISKSTLQNVLVGFGTIGDKIGEAADGADRLAAGAQSAATGAAALPGGATNLADGAGQLADGASRLGSGLTTISQGIAGAQTGAGQAATGLTQGADTLVAQGIVPAQVSGVAGTTAGNAQTAAGDTAALAKTLGALAQECAKDPTVPAAFCARVGGAAQDAVTAATAAGTASGYADGTVKALSAFDSAGSAALASQFRTAADGIDQLSAGLGRLADGTAQSASAANGLATGATGLQSGAAQLADGAQSLSTGVGSLATGTSGLASGLHQAADAMPKRTDAQASSLASVVAKPVTADTSGGMFGPTAVPLLAAVVLWFGGLASFIAMRAVTARTLTSRRSSASLALRGFAPAAAIGAVQGLLVSIVVQIVAGYDPARWWGFAGVAVLAGVVFAAVNQALVAVLGGAGRWIGAVVGVAALAAGIISTLPGWLAGIGGFLPVSPAATALLGDTGVGAAIAALVVWGVLSLVATTLAVAARRTTSARVVLAAA